MTRGGIDAIDEMIEGVESFGGEDAAVVLLLGLGGRHGYFLFFDKRRPELRGGQPI